MGQESLITKTKVKAVFKSIWPLLLSLVWFFIAQTNGASTYFQMVGKLASTIAVLVSANTIIYLYDVIKTTKKHATASSDVSVDACNWLAVVSLVVCLIWLIINVAWGYIAKENNASQERLHLEIGVICPLAIFVLFTFIDGLLWRFFSGLCPASGSDCDACTELRYYTGLFKFGDVPILIGLIILALGLLCFGPENNTITYGEHFLAGATLMHILTSQVIFIIISFSRKLETAKRRSAAANPQAP